MILLLTSLLFFSLIIIYLAFKFSVKINNKYESKINTSSYFFFSIAIVFSVSVISYIHKSNYWLGDTIFEKLESNKNLAQLNEVESLLYYMKQLEQDIKNSPEDFNKIKKLAETKYLLGDFSDAYNLFKLVKKSMPNNWRGRIFRKTILQFFFKKKLYSNLRRQ